MRKRICSNQPQSIQLFFPKQPVYRQLTLGWKFANQLSRLNPLSLSNNKNYRLKKNGVSPSQ